MAAKNSIRIRGIPGRRSGLHEENRNHRTLSCPKLVAGDTRLEPARRKQRIPGDPGRTDAATRDAAINKALDYAKRVQAVPRPTTLSEDEWQRSQGRAHSTVGLIQFNKGQFAEAATEYSQALKVNPKDPDGQYRIGVAYFN